MQNKSSTTPIKILVNGAFGKMGQTTIKAIEATPDFTLVAQLGRDGPLESTILDTQPDVVIDFSNAENVLETAKTIIKKGVHPVIGTSGLTEPDVTFLTSLCEKQKLGGIIAPNFSIGAVLMMHFSEIAAQYIQHAEIIEAHHDQKLDAPSGTAIKTADLMTKKHSMQYTETQKHIYKNARGANLNNVAIHSIRMPGLLAHQRVLFGSQGETLTIQHDTINRDCFMPGVLMACRSVLKLNTMLYGLENLILSGSNTDF